MKSIGGYFELELGVGTNDFPHALCPALNSGRHALEFILRQLDEDVEIVYLPYYTCDVVLEPLKRLGIGYKFYHINKSLEIEKSPKLTKGQYLIANNYFGIKDKYIDSLADKYGNQLIVDNSQALFAPQRLGIKAFYSPRKFVGVSDGGFAWTSITREINLEQDYSTERAKYLLKRIDAGASAGYSDFKDSSHDLSMHPMKRMSNLTYRILSSINYEEIKQRRRNNFDFLHSQLCQNNLLRIPATSSFECPMVYPFMTEDDSLRHRLIDNRIFVATYWPNVLEWCGKDEVEYSLAKNIIPLPIDQRYDEEDIHRVLRIVTDKKTI